MKIKSKIQNSKVKYEATRETLEEMIARKENDNEKMRGIVTASTKQK